LSDAETYPYIYEFLATPRLIVIGGFDKADMSGYLAYSNNGGATWVDASHLVGNATVELLANDADGRLLIGLYEAETFTLAELVLGERGLRRNAWYGLNHHASQWPLHSPLHAHQPPPARERGSTGCEAILASRSERAPASSPPRFRANPAARTPPPAAETAAPSTTASPAAARGCGSRRGG
jgi:hypothetical protein